MCVLIYTFLESRMRVIRLFSLTNFWFHDTIQLYDLVLFNNHRYYIKSRRSSGSFALVSVEGLKEENRSYKKLTLLAHTNAYLTNHYVNT